MTEINQNDLIFEPVKIEKEYIFKLPTNTSEIFIPSKNNIILNGLLYREDRFEFLIIYFQGNAKNIQNWLDNHSMAMKWNQSILVTDYRGFGKSEGKPESEDQMYADADVVFEYALNLGYSKSQIILYGYSLGSAMALHLASKHHIKALILESPFSSFPELSWVGNHAPLYKFENKEKAKHVTSPTLIVHGDLDPVVPKEHAHIILENLKTQSKELTILHGGGHGNLRARTEFSNIVIDFISKK